MRTVCFCGTGDKSGGCVRGLYDPTLSERGVLLCAARKPREKDPLDFEVSSKSIAPDLQSCMNRTCMARVYALPVDAARMALPLKQASASCLLRVPESSHSSTVYALLLSLIGHVLPVQQLQGLWLLPCCPGVTLKS